jgi:hypothetical protein
LEQVNDNHDDDDSHGDDQVLKLGEKKKEKKNKMGSRQRYCRRHTPANPDYRIVGHCPRSKTTQS